MTALSILLPLLVIVLVFVHEDVVRQLFPLFPWNSTTLQSNPTLRNLLYWTDLDRKRLIQLINPKLIAGVFGWVAVQAVLYRLVPCGSIVYGPSRIDGGESLVYRANGEYYACLSSRQ